MTKFSKKNCRRIWTFCINLRKKWNFFLKLGQKMAKFFSFILIFAKIWQKNGENSEILLKFSQRRWKICLNLIKKGSENLAKNGYIWKFWLKFGQKMSCRKLCSKLKSQIDCKLQIVRLGIKIPHRTSNEWLVISG